MLIRTIDSGVKNGFPTFVDKYLKLLELKNFRLFRFFSSPSISSASYGTIFATKQSSIGWLETVVSKRLSQGCKGLNGHRCSVKGIICH